MTPRASLDVRLELPQIGSTQLPVPVSRLRAAPLTARRSARDTVAVAGTIALVGCGPRLEIGLAVPGQPLTGMVALAGPTPRSELVVAAVDLLVRAAGMERDGLSAVAATRGPGSFTGIRVGLATAQGIMAALGIRARGFGSLEVQAARCPAGRVLALQPARSGQCFVQPFDVDEVTPPLPAGEPTIVPLADVAALTLPVIAPAGVALPKDAPHAIAMRTAAEALLWLDAVVAAGVEAPLAPLYLEPAPAQPRHGN